MATVEQRESCENAAARTSGLKLKAILARLTPLRSKQECLYCCETKRCKHFSWVDKKLAYFDCRDHVHGVCKSCIRASLSAQLSSKPLLQIGCPSCSAPWEAENLRVVLGHRDKKRFKRLDLLAKGRALVPSDIPESATMNELLDQGTRFCPWCRFPFVKEGGCDYMSCSRCEQGFNIAYALVLTDTKGRRAANVVESDLEAWVDENV